MSTSSKYKMLKNGDSPSLPAEAVCLQRYLKAKADWADFYASAKDDMKFLLGDQWNESTRRDREMAGRPVLTLPRTSNFIRQIEAQLRQSQTSLQVSSKTNGSKEDADIIANIVRAIESQSTAKNVYSLAGQFAVRTGLGFMRVVSDYPHWTSFDQNLYIEEITDPSRVLFDPNARANLLQDAQYVFIESVMARSEFESTVASPSARERIKNHGFQKYSDLVVDDETTIVLEYFYKTSKSTTIYKYVNSLTQDVILTEDRNSVDNTYILVNSRKTNKVVIKHCLFDGVEFYNETEFPGQIIPVVPVFGEVCNVNGELIIKGAISDVKDAQRLLNYTASVEVEVVDAAPKAPWLIAEGSIDGYEEQWRKANTSNCAYLLYKNKNSNPPPSRAAFDTNISAIATIKSQAEADIQNIFGIFDTQLGANSQEVSGVAINARNAGAAKSTYVYRDNLNASIRQVGQILVDAIPTFYNGRTITTIKANGVDAEVEVNLNEMDGFQVQVVSGPSDDTQRETLTSQLLNLATILPTAAPLLADIIVSNSDLIGSETVVARLKTLLPPAIVQAESQEIDENMAKTMLVQSAQQLDQLNASAQETEQQLQQCQQELQTLKADKSLDAQKMQMDYEVKMKQLQIDATKLQLDFEISAQNLKLQEEKLAYEATTGNQTDAIPDTSL